MKALRHEALGVTTHVIVAVPLPVELLPALPTCYRKVQQMAQPESLEALLVNRSS